MEQRQVQQSDMIKSLNEELNSVNEIYSNLELQNETNTHDLQKFRSTTSEQVKQIENLESEYSLKIKENVAYDNELDRQKS